MLTALLPLLTSLGFHPVVVPRTWVDGTPCIVMNADRLPLATRKSPLDSVTFKLKNKEVKICYGRPATRGRKMFGGVVPFGMLWRTGANEPTMIHTGIPLDLAGIKVKAGSYSLYTVPGPTEWVIIVNSSITQWGIESEYTPLMESLEVGRATVKSETVEKFAEIFTITATLHGGEAEEVVLTWENTRVAIPIRIGQ